MKRDFVLMVGDVHRVGDGVISFTQTAVGEMGFQGGALGIKASNGGAQACGRRSPRGRRRQHRCAGDGLTERVTHLAAPFEEAEGRCTNRILKQRAFGLRKAVHAHVDAL